MRERIIEIQADEELRIVHAKAPEPQPEPQEEPAQDGGEPQYKVGKLADAHFDVEDSHNSEYLDDLKNALRYFERQGVVHVDSTGDLCQYKDKDLIAFRQAYDSALPFFTCMGNHDYQRIYEQKDAAHQVPAGYRDFEDLWYQTVGSLAGGAEVHYFGTTFKDRLNFWFERQGDIFVYTSVDYGVSRDRYDVIRAVNPLDYDDEAVRQMTAYVADTQYDRSRERNFDYRFYNPAVLIWVKNLFEANPGKRKFWHAHHFLPGGAGDTMEEYRHLRIFPMPTPELIDNYFYSGSNTLCGLEMWFIEKLLRNNLNCICFGGHSHYAAKEQEDVVRRAYRLTLPTGRETTPAVADLSSLNGTQYDYKIYRTEGRSFADIAPTVHLPSLAKPAQRYGSTLYGASEGMLMEVYREKVVLKYVRFKAEGSGTYANEVVKTVELAVANDGSPVVEPEMPPQPAPQPAPKGIRIVFRNNTGQDIRFAGKFLPYIKEQDEAIDLYLCAPNVVDDWCHWRENPYSLKAGDTMAFDFTHLTHYTASKGRLITTQEPVSNYFGKHFRTADSAEWPTGIAAVKFGVCFYDRSKKETSTNAAMIHAVPLPEGNCLIREGGVYEVVLDRIKQNATLDRSWIARPYKDGDAYKYAVI